MVIKTVRRETINVRCKDGYRLNLFQHISFTSHVLRLKSNGFTYITVMMLVVVIGIALSMTGRHWSTVVKREKEEELLFRGDQIRKGIEEYYKWTAQKHGGQGVYPENLEELVKSKFAMAPKRSLRRIYSDPITGKADWVIVQDPQTKRMMGVRSASEGTPLKTANFPFIYRGFEGKTKYSDWIFGYSPQKSNMSPVAVGTAGGVTPTK